MLLIMYNITQITRVLEIYRKQFCRQS